ncbi:hypothetical protein RMSM_00488 [Rhodopirellula maiorica SM1]|uniref:Uncharacterized protein n=1 Tax=Rhodopirellula maiorica SM1 TaxID=1265738 RepID=M5S8U0_9BACT|nr:hypothetical protein [Rhodopirellula maiorica]EMI22589.1 hypothetical protein RMSM_00488 [Rhodopirellula maiorica SM1]
MAVSSKRRNRINVDDRAYLWWVAPDNDSLDIVLHVISEDKRFNVLYVLGLPSATRYATVIGNEFGTIVTGGSWRRFLCPRFDTEGQVTPRHVRFLLKWAAAADSTIHEVDAAGLPVPFGGLCDACGRDLRGMLRLDAVSCCYCDHPVAGRTQCCG